MKIGWKAVVAAVALSSSTLTGCASLKRAGCDLAVIGTCWATIPLSAVHDSLDFGEEVKDATPIVLAPFNIPLHMIKHTAYTVVYAADLCVAPFYLLSHVFRPRSTDLPPIELYHITFKHGYPWKSSPWPAFEE